MPLTPADACARYLARLGGRTRLVTGPYGLYADLDTSLQGLTNAGAAFLASAQQQLDQIDLRHRFHFGLVATTIDPDTSPRSEQEAYAVTDMFAGRGEAPASFLLFTISFVRDVFMAWDALLSRRELFREIGNPDAEQPVRTLVYPRPQDPTRAAYARDQASLALEFALYHEFYHVAAGHLDAIRTGQPGARLHAVIASSEQAQVDTRFYKVLELDADVMALRHQTMGVLGGKTLLAHELLAGSSDIERFRHLGRGITLLFRLIELWRRNVRLRYTAEDFHPHPDVRDATLHAYLRANADPEGSRSIPLADAYAEGQTDIVNALESMNTLAPTFGIVEGLGQDLAIRETEWLVPQLNRIRKDGVGPLDFRRLAARRRAAASE